MGFRRLLPIAAVLIATLFAFLPVLGNGFVNWDDPWTLQRNAHLAAPGVLQWAFTTGEMGHYQPLTWLVWSQTKALFGLDATPFHALSLIGHLLNAALVYLVCVRLAAIPSTPMSDESLRASPSTPMSGKSLRASAGLKAPAAHTAAAIAAFVFAVHPLRVEAVAWASAFPYVLSLTFVLAALLAYLASCSAAGRHRLAWLGLSATSYALSQFTRASAIAFPLVLLLIDWYPLRRVAGRRRTSWRSILLEKSPFFIIAVAAAIAESRARELPTLEEVGLGARLALAAPAPFLYLWRTLLPVGLSPLDPLPIEPRVAWIPLALGLAGLAAVSMVVWRERARWPALAVAWAAYVLLLGPAMGLTPSGQQATADRYMYIPGVVLSLLIGVAARSDAIARRRLGTAMAVVALAAAAALGVTTWRQTTWWHDSVALWTRAADLDPENDIASYNLAIALADAGREEEAIVRYEQTLRLVPDHEFAQHNLNLIRATQAEREGDRLAQAGDLDAAIDRYARALAADPTRLHARAARGMALLQRARFMEAAADLRVAFDTAARLEPASGRPSIKSGRPADGPDATATATRAKEDAAVASALAFALVQTGRHAEAAAVLTQALGRYPEDHELAHNLARLLATAPDPAVRNGAMALRLALAVRDQTGGRDPRVLDTLAAAYASEGQFDLARETAEQAAQLASRLGDAEMAREIAKQARAYERRRIPNAAR